MYVNDSSYDDRWQAMHAENGPSIVTEVETKKWQKGTLEKGSLRGKGGKGKFTGSNEHQHRFNATLTD